MTNKPDLTRIWANTADPSDIKDPDLDQAGKFSLGWLPEIPPHTWFNYLQNFITSGLAHFNEYGIAQWDTDTVYPQNGWARSTVDGNVYVALSANSGNEPSASPAQWAALSSIFGDLLAANNLSDVDDAASAFDNIKQSATTGATGVVEKATQTETNNGAADKFPDAAAIKAVTDQKSAGVVNIVTSQTSGSYVKPAGLKSLKVYVTGGGGSGGTATDGNTHSASGGSGGGTAVKTYLESELSASEAYVIGSGGAAQASLNQNGNNGGNSTFKGLTASGGIGGLHRSNDISRGRTGGTASGGDLNLRGGASSGSADTGGAGCTDSGGESFWGGAGGGGDNGSNLGTAGVNGAGGGIGIDAASGAGGTGIIVFEEYF